MRRFEFVKVKNVSELAPGDLITNEVNGIGMSAVKDGSRILLMCSNYFCEGEFRGVDFETGQILLSDPVIGELGAKWWEDMPQLRTACKNDSTQYYVMLHAVESWCLTPQIMYER